jgi:hypothetical protein
MGKGVIPQQHKYEFFEQIRCLGRYVLIIWDVNVCWHSEFTNNACAGFVFLQVVLARKGETNAHEKNSAYLGISREGKRPNTHPLKLFTLRRLQDLVVTHRACVTEMIGEGDVMRVAGKQWFSPTRS